MLPIDPKMKSTKRNALRYEWVLAQHEIASRKVTHSTLKSIPVQNELASEAKNTVGPLYSYGRDTR